MFFLSPAGRDVAANNPPGVGPGPQWAFTVDRRVSAAQGLDPQELALQAVLRMYAANPDQYQGDLARTLYGWGNRLTALGRHEESLTCFQDAYVLSRQAGDRMLLTLVLGGL